MKKLFLIICSVLFLLSGCQNNGNKPVEPTQTAEELLAAKGFALKGENLEFPFDKDIIFAAKTGEGMSYRLVDKDFAVYNISDKKYSSTEKNYEVVELDYEPISITGGHLLDSNMHCRYTNGPSWWDVTFENIDVSSHVTSYGWHENETSYYCVTLKKDNKIYLQEYSLYAISLGNLKIPFVNERVLFDGKDEKILTMFASETLPFYDWKEESITFCVIVITTENVYIGLPEENPEYVEYADKESYYFDKYKGMKFEKSDILTMLKDKIYFIEFDYYASTMNIVLKDGSYYRGQRKKLAE